MHRFTLPTLVVLTALAACDGATDVQTPDAPDEVLAALDGPAPGAVLDDADANDNGLVCLGPSSPRGEVVVDDRQGACPRGFVLTALAPPSTVAAGSRHACALDATGGAWCWGANPFGELGDGGFEWTTVPVRVQGVPALATITAGNRFTCGLDEEGTAWCWGHNGLGQLGTGDPTLPFSPVPVPVTGNVSFKRLDAGERYACGLDAAKQLHCWGSNQFGALGAATTDVCGIAPCSRSPVPSAPGLLFTDIDAGLANSCGVATDGLSYCWGWDIYHQGGDGIASEIQPPTPVVAPVPMDQVVAGSIGGCGLDGDGGAWCWSDFPLPFGWLGNGLYAGSPTPVEVIGGHAFGAIASADANNFLWFQCGIDDQEAAWCWGSHYYGQLGTDEPTDICPEWQPNDPDNPCSATPVLVAGGHAWSELDLGEGFACGRTTSGEVYCWGRNDFGTLGDGTLDSRPLPAPVAFGEPATLASAGPAPATDAGGPVDPDTRVFRD